MSRTRFLRFALAGAVVLAAGVVALATASPALAVPGIALYYEISAEDSTATKSATVTCPEGTRVLGGGGFIYGGDRRVSFTRLQANGSSDTFVATATESGAYPGVWQVQAFGICGTAPAGLTFISYHTVSDSDGVKAALATCPAGKQLVSVGARTHGGEGQVVIDDIVPSGSLTSVSVSAYEDETGYAGNWSLWAYGVCANPLPGLELRSADSAPLNSTDDAVWVSCSAGKKVHGIGGKIVGGVGEVMYAGLYPGASLSSATLIAIEEANGQSSDWSSTVYAICAN